MFETFMADLPTSSARRTLLVVDDEPVVRDILRRYLSQMNFEIILANCGEVAVDSARTLKPDLVLLDVQMPGMGGLECLKKLLGLYPKLQVLMLTGANDEDIVRETLRLGASDYLTKPIDLPSLKRVLKVRFPVEP